MADNDLFPDGLVDPYRHVSAATKSAYRGNSVVGHRGRVLH